MTMLSNELFERSIKSVEERVPDLAPRCMKVPLSYYRDEALADRERQLFLTQPRPLAGSSQIPAPSNFLVMQTMGVSVVLTRDAKGKAHAFLNYCRHRGAEVARGCGKASRLVCPYHGWVYDLNGKLLSMPLASRNTNFDHERHGLVELPSEERHGLIWVILTPGTSIDVAAHLGPVDKQLAEHSLEKRRYFPAYCETITANWKSVSEGNLEALHVPFVHKATFNVDPRTDEKAKENRYSGFPDLGVFESLGHHVHWILPIFVDGIEAARLAHMEGRPLGWEQLGNLWFLSPGVVFANDVYGVAVGLIEPGPTIDSTIMRGAWMAPEVAPPIYPSPEEMAKRLHTATLEDISYWDGCGRGLALGAHSYALVGRNERGVQLFHEALSAQIGFNGLAYE
jgi:nitrite reductase/ring-hydroxylating ferredoxin subunit